MERLVTDLVFSFFFACYVIRVRRSSAHCMRNSITRASLSAIMFREQRLELRVEVCFLVQDEIQV